MVMDVRNNLARRSGESIGNGKKTGRGSEAKVEEEGAGEARRSW
jgi:hypothetical protein